MKRASYFTLVLTIFIAFAVASTSANNNGDDVKQLAVEYLNAFEPDLKTATHPFSRYLLLKNLASAAIAAGSTEKATAFATELLTLAPELGQSKGSAAHIGHTILGGIALDKGDLAKAKASLLAAGQIASDPMLTSVGPEMLLAKRLIEKGERSSAIKYFEACGSFWRSDKGRLARWTSEVNAGGVPDFGLNIGVVYDIRRFARSALVRRDPANLRRFAARHIAEQEPRLKSAATDSERYRLLYDLVPAALSAGEIEKAKSFAGALLEMAPRLEKTPGFGPGNKGAAIHIANIVLGRIAFNEGRIADAKKHLLGAAGINAGNPVLMSFGPHTLLAKLLIEKGEREVVIEYLNLCAMFWQSENGRIAKWTDALKAGGTPDFGGAINNFTDSWLNGD